MLLYHGSNLVVEQPRPVEQSRGLDFGPGFYLTSREQQAVRFSEIVADRRRSGAPTVSVYEFDAETAEMSMEIRRFPEANKEWLRFVAANRTRSYQGAVHDIIVGPVANDAVMPTVQAFLSGLISEDATIVALMTSKLFDQWCLKSERALSLLHFVASRETERGRTHG